jgi:hypothetical protein
VTPAPRCQPFIPPLVTFALTTGRQKRINV